MALETIGLGGVLRFDEKQAVGAMGRASGAFGNLQKGAQRVSATLGGVATAMRNAGLAGIAIGTGLAFAINASREFGKAVGEVSTIADEAEFPLERIRKITKDLAVQYGTMPVEQAKAMYQAISAGAASAADATNVMNTANRLAIGGVSDVFTSIDVLTTAVNAYAAADLEAADASDIIFKTVQFGKTTVDELGASLGQVIPTAAALNINFEELGAAMGTITKSGISSAEASTALNAALLNMWKPSEEARKVAKKLGIDFSAAALKNKDLVTVLNEAATAAEGNDRAITALFGSVRALKAITVLTANDGKVFNQALKAMEGRAGATDEAFRKMSQTTDFQLNRMNALRKASLTTLGEIMEPLAFRLLTPLGEMAEKLFDILEAVRSKDFDKLSGRSAEIARGINDAIKAIDETVTKLSSHFDELGKALRFAFGAGSVQEITSFGTQTVFWLGVGGPVLLALSGLVLFIKTVVIPAFLLMGITSATAFWPITLAALVVGLAIYTLGEDIYQLIPTIMDVADTVGGVINDVILTAIKWATDAIWGFDAGLRSIFSGDILAGIKKLGQTLLDFVLDPIRLIVRTVIRLADAMAVTGKAGFIPAGLRQFAEERAPVPLREGRPGAIRRAPERGLFGGGIPVKPEGPVTVTRTLTGPIFELQRKQAEALWEREEKRTKEFLETAKAARKAAEEAARAAGSSEKAAKQRRPVKLDLDGREVARSSAKHQEEIKARSGFKAQPWQRRLAAEHGAVTV